MWLEMSRDEEHGGPGWEFTTCLWAPTHKNPTGKWPYWDSLLHVKVDDIVFHLRGKTHKAAFVGYSIATSNGYTTTDRPQNPNKWSYANSFYRVDLATFTPFASPISLKDVFDQCSDELLDNFVNNKSSSRPEHLFYVYQSYRLQCLNGAYLSNFNNKLASIILGPDFAKDGIQPRPTRISVETGHQIAEVRIRYGQKEFSDNVRSNYENTCCFPGCSIKDSDFLIGSHIARWADVPELRGQTSNGLCFCLLHDKAFEIGIFTLNNYFEIKVNPSKLNSNCWAIENILPYEGQRIRMGEILPSIEALEHHWQRINFYPTKRENLIYK